MSRSPDYIILGAGVIGLTTALELKDRLPDASVTIVAKYVPGDRSIEYTSPWAGGNWQSAATDNGPAEARDAVTWHKWEKLLKTHPECGLQKMPLRILRDGPIEDADVLSKDTGKIWYEELVGGFKYLKGEELQGAEWGVDLTSFLIDVGVYLPWLYNQVLKRGVKIHRSVISGIEEIFTRYPDSKAVFNCLGLAARFLKGVEDKDVYPIRGQTLLVETPNPPLTRMYVRSPKRISPEPTYIFPRNPGGGIILGGCFQENNWSSEIDMDLVERIKERACALAPELGRKEDLKVIMHGVGLRPARKGGARVEREVVGGRVLVHNYGISGAGYQASWGLAKDAVDLIEKQSKL